MLYIVILYIIFVVIFFMRNEMVYIYKKRYNNECYNLSISTTNYKFYDVLIKKDHDYDSMIFCLNNWDYYSFYPWMKN